MRRPAGAAWSCARRAAVCSARSATTAWDSTCVWCASGTASTGWACRESATAWRPPAASSRSPPRPARERGSTSRFPWSCEMPLRVLLADDHRVVRDGLRALLHGAGFEVLAEATNGQEAIKMAEAGNPDVAIVDVGMPLLNGIDAAREIVRLCPRTRVILLTMHTEDHHVV